MKLFYGTIFLVHTKAKESIREGEHTRRRAYEKEIIREGAEERKRAYKKELKRERDGYKILEMFRRKMLHFASHLDQTICIMISKT